MSASKAYQVIIMKSRKLNIIMANNSGAQLRTYSHFVTLEDARRFADILEESLAEGKYWDVDRCQLCGEAFTRQNHLCLLKDGRVIHMQSLDAELLQAAVSRIHIQGKKIKIQLKSGQILERRLQT